METNENLAAKKTELAKLIRESKMTDAEKEAWLNLLEEMLEQEILEFIKILRDEENSFKLIEEKYQARIQKIKADFNQQWQDFITKSKTEIKKTEKNKIQQDEKVEMDKLRKQLQ